MDNMNDFATFYLITSVTQILPSIVITLCLLHGITFPTISYMLGHRAPVNPGPLGVGFARLKHFLRFLKSTTVNYMTRFYLLASFTKLITTVLIVLAIHYDVSLPFVGNININDRMPEGTLLDLMLFSLSTSALQLIPVVVIVLTLFYGIHLPFLPSPSKKRAPSKTEIIRAEQQSQDFASIVFTRFENSQRTSIYARCRNDRLGTVFKVALCQGKEADAKTRSYMYLDDNSNLHEIVPPPIGVNELEEIFNFENN